ncbi:bifunctional tetrahydrofolate synthase/dihydrofolate synthase [Faucicola mancuniensis]|uniref:bifunctional tetrahydrofolate synthase/dihydrofolate synthase n=1 Tax=Faucicola mancuniensis TaxID=1309795 RepID=UPI003977440B
MQTPTINSSLNAWLDYMHTIHVSAIDMGLERVLPVFDKLAIDYQNTYIFTVAGTNGKGSTTATIAKICEQAGYKVALYQSPHLIDFNERVKINGGMVDDNTLIEAFAKVEQARLDCGLTLSFFEMTTLASFWIFGKQQCDVWVLEVGLGGRLDVVNIIDPDVAVITNVGIDHVDWLGDTREKIGMEKAGILRKNIPLIYGETDMPSTVLPLIEQHQAKLLQFGTDYFYQAGQGSWQYSNASVTLDLPLPSLSLHNTATAITAVLASDLPITQENIAQALPNITLAGRFDQRIIHDHQWLFDVAHNEHGIRFLLSQFVPFWQNYQQKFPSAKLYLIFSMLADKDIDNVLLNLQTLPIEKIFCGEIDFFRALPKAELQTKLAKFFDNFVVVDNLEQATEQAILQSEKHDLMLVCGSFHTISEVLQSKIMQ